MKQKHQISLILIIQALLVVVVTGAIGFRLMPAGVPGEWEWSRLADWAVLKWDGLMIAGAGVLIYAGFAATGLHLLGTARSRVYEAACVAGLLFASICIQIIVPMGAPAGYDLTKWAAVNYIPGSAGYFQVAREKASGDAWKFLADYPVWIRTQDVFHIGTHPPGLIAAQCVLLRTMERNPRLAARFWIICLPRSTRVFGFSPTQMIARSRAASGRACTRRPS